MTRDDIIRMARWQKVPSFPRYEVSSCGHVKRGNRLLRQSLNANGYPRVTMSVNGKSVSRTVHSLVMEAFVGARPDGMHIRHKDGIRTNNVLANLAYCTPSENEADKLIHGTRPFGDRNGMRTQPEARPRGCRHGKTVLVEAQVLVIKQRLASGVRGEGVRLAREYGVSPQVISEIKCGKVWGHVSLDCAAAIRARGQT